jgi:hypothetical protein
MRKTSLLALTVLSFLTSVHSVGENSPLAQKQDVKIICTVVAYDDFINVVGAPQRKLLIVRINRLIRGSERSRYTKVLFTAIHGQKGLPKQMSSGKGQWLFSLVRATGNQCKIPVNEWIRADAAKRITLPNVENLPCYLLDQDGFKPYKPNQEKLHPSEN